MNTTQSFITSLQSLVGTAELIEVDRSPVTSQNLIGFVVGANDRFLTLSLVDDSFFLNGFAIVRTDDVKQYRIEERRREMIRYVLAQRYPEGYLRVPIVELGELNDFSFLERIQESYPLITIHREVIDNTVCSIGRIEALKAKTFLLHDIDIDSEWDGIRRFRYEDVTRIDFGGNYEEALWMYAEHLHKERSRSK